MKPVVVFRHIECEGPGYLGQFLGTRKIPYRVIAIDAGDPVPESLPECSGLAFMGGPMSVNDDLPWIDAELELIRTAVEREVPVLGHCLGGQLIAKALGASIGSGNGKEIGWHDVQTVTGDSAYAQVLPGTFPAFHWHGETFALPEGAGRLLTNENCANQAFVAGSALALQCHVEMTPELVREWVLLYADEIESPQGAIQPVSEILSDLENRCTALQRAADLLYSNWLTGLG